MIEIDQAVTLLKQGKNVGIPTETVYGLAGMVDNPQAIEGIFKIKERPFFDPLIMHVSSPEMAQKYTTQWSAIAQKLAETFWPGPLTMVLPKKDNVNPMITSGLESVGLRCPNHPLTLNVIEKLDIPLAAPSANKFKKTSPTTAQAVLEEFGDDFPVIDGGSCDIGIESTVVGVFDNEIQVYRPGKITVSDIQKALADQSVKVVKKESPVAPGQLKHHYMPNIPLIICQKSDLHLPLKELNIDESFIHEWSLSNDPVMACRMLYQDMREIAKTDAKAIWLDANRLRSEDEIWEAIVNRLEKASTFYQL
jgi:L-threonylcarbamoyladenylate synthase